MPLKIVKKNITTDQVKHKIHSEVDDKQCSKHIVVIRVPNKAFIEVAIKAALNYGQYDLQIIVDDDRDLTYTEHIDSRLKKLEKEIEGNTGATEQYTEHNNSRLKKLEKEIEGNTGATEQYTEHIDSRLKKLEKEISNKEYNEQYRDVYERKKIEYEYYCNMLDYKKTEYNREMINVLTKDKNKYQYEKAEYERKEKIDYEINWFSKEERLNKSVNRKKYLRMKQDANTEERNIFEYEKNEHIRIKNNNDMEEKNKLKYKKKKGFLIHFTSYLDEKKLNNYDRREDQMSEIKFNNDQKLKELQEKYELQENITKQFNEYNTIKEYNLRKNKNVMDLKNNNDYVSEMFKKHNEYNKVKYDKIKSFREFYGSKPRNDEYYAPIFYGNIQISNKKCDEDLVEDKIQYERMEKNIIKCKENMEKLNIEEYEKTEKNIQWVIRNENKINDLCYSTRKLEHKLELQKLYP